MGTINKAENSLEDKVVNTLADHDRALRELKAAAQPIGADILKVQSIPSGTVILAGPLTLAAGVAGTYNVSFTPATGVLTLWNFAHTAYVDAVDTAHQFPNGSSLTAASRSVRVTSWFDWADSSDVTNVRVYKIRFENYDTVSHGYYLQVKAYLPLLAGSTGA